MTKMHHKCLKYPKNLENNQITPKTSKMTTIPLKTFKISKIQFKISKIPLKPLKVTKMPRNLSKKIILLMRVIKMTKMYHECPKYPKILENNQNTPKTSKITTIPKTLKITKIPLKPKK